MKITVNSKKNAQRSFKPGDIVQHREVDSLYILGEMRGSEFRYTSLPSGNTGTAAFSSVYYKLFEGTVTLQND